MALQRPIVLVVVVVAALDSGIIACAGPAPAAPSAPGAVAPAADSGLGREVAALRAQQLELVQEVRGMKGELAQLATRSREPVAAAPIETVRAETPEIVAPAPAALDPAPTPASDAPSADDGPAAAASEASPASSYVAVAKRLIEDEDYATAVRVLNVAADVDPDYDEIYFERGVAKHLLQSFGDAIDDFQAAIDRTVRQDLRYICLYNQACGLARLGKKEDSIARLVQSDEAGFRELLEQMTTDPDLDSLRDQPSFKEFVMMLRTR